MPAARTPRTRPAPAPATDSGPAMDVSQWTETRDSARARKAAEARQVSGRRRFIDPTTCDKDYTEEQWEFMVAMQAYKLSSGRMFPTWSEVLEVLQGLGYQKG